MTTYYSATPAYGRDYKSQKEVLRHWHSGGDIQLHHGIESTYANKDSFGDEERPVQIHMRYARGTKSMVIDPSKGPPSWLAQEVDRSPNRSRDPRAEAARELGIGEEEMDW